MARKRGLVSPPGLMNYRKTADQAAYNSKSSALAAQRGSDINSISPPGW